MAGARVDRDPHRAVPVLQLVAGSHATGASTPPAPIENTDTLAEPWLETYTPIAPAPAGTTAPSASKTNTPATNSAHRREPAPVAHTNPLSVASA